VKNNIHQNNLQKVHYPKKFFSSNELVFISILSILFVNDGKIFNYYLGFLFFIIFIFFLNKKLIQVSKFIDRSSLFILILLFFSPAILFYKEVNYYYIDYYLILIISFPILFLKQLTFKNNLQFYLLLLIIFLLINIIGINNNPDGTLRSFNGPNILYRHVLFFYVLLLLYNFDRYYLITLLTFCLILLIGSRAGFLIFISLFYLLNMKKNKINLLLISFIFVSLFFFLKYYLEFQINLDPGLRKQFFVNFSLFFNNYDYFQKFSNSLDWQHEVGKYFYPHNIFLELMYTSGIIGAYISLILIKKYIVFFLYDRNYFLLISPFVLGSFFSGGILDNIGCVYLLLNKLK
jgi:hypothetical protein